MKKSVSIIIATLLAATSIGTYVFAEESTSESTNDNKDVANELSIVADPYAFQHFSNMRFVEHMGVKWKITAVKPQPPRLILTVGGIYNGGSEQAEIAE